MAGGRRWLRTRRKRRSAKKKLWDRRALGGALGAEGALLGRGRFGSASELELDSFRGARESPEVGSGSVDASPEASDVIAPVYGLSSFGGGRPLLSLAGYAFQQAFSGLRLTAGIGFLSADNL